MPPSSTHLHRLVRKTRTIPSRIVKAPPYLGRFARALKTDPGETLAVHPRICLGSSVRCHRSTTTSRRTLGPPFTSFSAFRGRATNTTASKKSGRTSEETLRHWDSRSVVGPTGSTAMLILHWARSRGVPSGTSARRKVIETGVARGVTSRIILEAMALIGSGHLWSVDLPHPLAPRASQRDSMAVPFGLPREVDVCPRLEPPTAPLSRVTSRESGHVRA